MHRRVWEFQVREGKEDEFIRMNNIDWPRLFSRSPGYIETEVGRVNGKPRLYVTTDTWRAEGDFTDFLERHRDTYDDLDRKHAELYESATQLEPSE